MGIFVRYTDTDRNIRYVDVKTIVVKIARHTIFHGAWYLQIERPPAAQMLYDLGLEEEKINTSVSPSETSTAAPYPIMYAMTVKRLSS